MEKETPVSFPSFVVSGVFVVFSLTASTGGAENAERRAVDGFSPARRPGRAGRGLLEAPSGLSQLVKNPEV
jgi:hypothetical protein